MIKRPEQIRLLALGLPDTPANRSDSNSSESKTENNYADRRNAVQGGAAISGDNNTMFTSITTTDQGAVQAGLGAAVAALGANNSVANNAIWAEANTAGNATDNMARVSQSTLTASSHLADVGLAMLQTNTALANSLEGGVNQAMQATTGIAQQLAQTQVAAANDNRYLIAAGMAVVAIVGVMAFSKGKA
ncbi:hypothetical protein [Burkholderia ubonensis]|uniref:hypothetical protein n=1 Tax=Burkholderia ubonensis TaxID=101571 RepID=UPI0007552330|nr:hypothetical protein [Burkholderia ubonensis]KWF19828.1 hypothetical protein WL83_09640 [Burkholderia ubonensis]